MSPANNNDTFFFNYLSGFFFWIADIEWHNRQVLDDIFLVLGTHFVFIDHLIHSAEVRAEQTCRRDKRQKCQVPCKYNSFPGKILLVV